MFGSQSRFELGVKLLVRLFFIASTQFVGHFMFIAFFHFERNRQGKNHRIFIALHIANDTNIHQGVAAKATTYANLDSKLELH